MKNDITFVTMFPRIENIHLVKDVGMIPYAMNKYYNLNSSIVIYKKQKYDYLNDHTINIDTKYFPLKKFNSKLNCLLFLIKNSKKIDVLHLYHLHQKTTWFCIPIYFFMNHKGLIYIHMDNNLSNKELDFFGKSNSQIKEKLKHFYLNKIVFNKKNRKRMLFGIQNKNGEKKLKNTFPFDNIVYVPDGYENLTTVNNTEKENIIIFVGRVGTRQKRTDILLDGFIKAYDEIPNWKLKIIGPIEKNFEKEIEQYKKKHPHVFKNIEFTGPIMNRKILMNEYKKAKIFCLPSDYESFGLVLVEAISNGCTIVSSNITSSIEILDKEQYGYLFETSNSESLSKILVKACNDKQMHKFVEQNGENYIKNNFSYERALKPVFDWIIENKKNR